MPTRSSSRSSARLRDSTNGSSSISTSSKRTTRSSAPASHSKVKGSERSSGSASSSASSSSEKRKRARSFLPRDSKQSAPMDIDDMPVTGADAEAMPEGDGLIQAARGKGSMLRGASPAPSPARECRASPRATPGKGNKRMKRGEASASDGLEDSTAVAPRRYFRRFPSELLYELFSYLVEDEDQAEGRTTIENMMAVCSKWKIVANDPVLWRSVPQFNADGSVNWRNFRKIKQKSKGTEGVCHKCLCRSSGEMLAVKKARVFPDGEGVAYYMLRELAVLQDVVHPNVNRLAKANLAKDELHIFFPYVEHTLQDVLVGPNPHALAPENGKTPLTPHQVRRLLHQLLDAVAYCHRRGVYHRNLKPKHLLLQAPEKADGKPDLDKATLQVADFALVRASGLPRRKYTAKVVTLWYRAPEILMGVTEYSDLVDAWSVGCVFAEMALGKPLFTGSSEIDQLFQLFSTLGTPSNSVWEGFEQLPNYGAIFPNWPPKPFERIVPDLDPLGRDLMKQLLRFDPKQRITCEEALRHPYFTGPCEPERALVPVIPMATVPSVPPGSSADTAQPPAAIAAREDRYVVHLEEHLRASEAKAWPITGYKTPAAREGEPEAQLEVISLHRGMLVDWLVELVDVFDMYVRSAFLAVAFTDAFLSRETVDREKLQLVAATCLHVASKCEDTAYISVNDLVMCADNLYSAPEVLRMEETLLNKLDFRLGVPTTYDFLKLIMEKLPQVIVKKSNAAFLAEYFAELSMQDYGMLGFMPSRIAACCISLALYIDEKPHWTDELASACGWSWADLREPMECLQRIYRGVPTSQLTVIRIRYEKPERNSVANLTAPPTYDMSWD